MNIDPFSEVLHAARLAAGLSKREAARRAGMSPAVLSDCERGYHAPSLANLRRWAAGLGFELTLTKITTGGPVSTSPETGPEPESTVDGAGMTCTCDCHSCCIPLDQSCELCRADHKGGAE